MMKSIALFDAAALATAAYLVGVGVGIWYARYKARVAHIKSRLLLSVFN
jgi:hypothetical protein